MEDLNAFHLNNFAQYYLFFAPGEFSNIVLLTQI